MSSEGPVACLRGVRKVYGQGPGAVEALRGVDLEVPRRSFWVLMGPSGSGKSTLLHLLGCMDAPTQGNVEIEGIPVPPDNDRERTRLRSERIGFVFQAFHLLPDLTVSENIELPRLFLPSRGRRTLPSVEDLLDRVHLPRTLADRRPTEISGGEAQRVAIARALANRPSLLLGDEPTGNLDSVNARTVLEVLRELWQEGSTILLATHNTLVASYAQRVLHLEDGRIRSPAGGR
jgi:putative ABC transport system ATP-binding protein